MSEVFDGLRRKIETATLHIASRDDTKMNYADATKVSQALVKEVIPDILHATNNEPWYASKVTLGAVATLIGGSYALVMDFADGTMPTGDSFTGQVVAIACAALALYGRWAARKPV